MSTDRQGRTTIWRFPSRQGFRIDSDTAVKERLAPLVAELSETDDWPHTTVQAILLIYDLLLSLGLPITQVFSLLGSDAAIELCHILGAAVDPVPEVAR